MKESVNCKDALEHILACSDCRIALVKKMHEPPVKQDDLRGLGERESGQYRILPLDRGAARGSGTSGN